MLDDLKKLDKVLEDIDRLKRRSELLEFILSKYNTHLKEFDFPKEWPNKRILPEHIPAENPRAHLEQKIREALTYDEQMSLGLY